MSPRRLDVRIRIAMLHAKSFVKKTKRGKVLKVVRCVNACR